jgi:hypothetical protein
MLPIDLFNPNHCCGALLGFLPILLASSHICCPLRNHARRTGVICSHDVQIFNLRDRCDEGRAELLGDEGYKCTLCKASSIDPGEKANLSICYGGR